MSLPRYREYKDSGVVWLGRVPAHWTLSKLRHFTRFTGGGTPSRDVPAYWNGDIPWVSPKDMKTERISGAEELITRAGLDNSTSSLVDPDRVLLVVRSGILKHTIPVAINGVAVALNQDMKALEFEGGICTPKFFMRWVQGYNDNLLLTWAKQGATVESIEHAYLADTVIPLPQSEEQSAIITFLDRETSKIDALVAEQEKLISLLAKKRQATISHAITRGLDPNAPLKDSGAAWLSDVPEHWEVKKLRYVANVVRGASPRPAGDPRFFASDNESGVNCPWVTVAEVTKDEQVFLNDVVEYLTPTGVESSQSFEAGTLIFTNSGATLGVPKILAIDCCANDGILAFRHLSDNVDIHFLYYFLLTTTERLRTEMKQGGGQPNLNTGIVKEIFLPLPPKVEQLQVVEFLTTEILKLDSLRAQAERAITLLMERRVALIAAAITGQFDVRGAMPAAAVSPEAMAA